QVSTLYQFRFRPGEGPTDPTGISAVDDERVLVTAREGLFEVTPSGSRRLHKAQDFGEDGSAGNGQVCATSDGSFFFLTPRGAVYKGQSDANGGVALLRPADAAGGARFLSMARFDESSVVLKRAEVFNRHSELFRMDAEGHDERLDVSPPCEEVSEAGSSM